MRRRLFLFTLVCVVLLSMVSATAAQDVPRCDGLWKALDHIPSDSPGYAKVLEKWREDCGWALDHAALLALYNSTDGEYWTYNTNWLVTDDHCDDWYGVQCDDYGRVYRLLLENNQLSGSIPPELGNLSNLTWLWLYNNQLSGSIPRQLGNLSNLTRLWLNDNQLSGSVPQQLGNLSNLTWLGLNDNQLSGIIPRQLGNLSNLTRLLLQNNQLSGIIPWQLGNLSNLTHLSLDDNQLSGSIPWHLGNLSNLQLLWLNDNQLSGSIPWQLGNLSNLKYLYLHSQTGAKPLDCWETPELYAWAESVRYHFWDDPPGTTVCPTP